MESPTNGSNSIKTAPEPHAYSRFPLTAKQQEFFKRRRAAIQQIENEMRGALQMVVEENELSGKITMADDGTELIIDTE